MFSIVKKDVLSSQMTRWRLAAPLIARRARAGQFVILRLDETGERVPFTIADYDRAAGTIDIIFQSVGATTQRMQQLRQGDSVLDLVGPLGNPTPMEGARRAVVIGGGAGCAIAYPSAKALHEAGAAVTMIAGFRTQEIVMLEDEMRAASDRLTVMTDDGSNGRRGFVTDALKELLANGETFDLCLAIGPVRMMQAVCAVTKDYGIKTIVSMNPIMLDGTGMCGCCRVTVNGEIKFACVDGPDFDGQTVDFEELLRRGSAYAAHERSACLLFLKKKPPAAGL